MPLLGAVVCGGLALGPWPCAQGQSASDATSETGASRDLGLYTWVDAQGIYHLVDSLGQVPADQRAAARARAELGLFSEEKAGGNDSGANFSVISGDGSAQGASGGSEAAGAGISGSSGSGASAEGSAPAVPSAPVRDKSYWQNRFSDARAKRDAAELELKKLDEEALRLRNLTPTNFHALLQELEVKRVQQQSIVTLMNAQLNGGIASEARREGVPPGWLRSK